MASVAFEPKTIVLLQDVTLDLVKPDFQASFQYVEEVLSLVRVGAIAARPGRNSNQHGFEHLGAG